MEEMTSRLPVTESPLWKRITAGVYSVGRIRGARQADDADWHVICLIVSIDLSLHCIGDYERVSNSKVTPVGPEASLRESGKREPFNNRLRMSAWSLVRFRNDLVNALASGCLCNSNLTLVKNCLASDGPFQRNVRASLEPGLTRRSVLCFLGVSRSLAPKSGIAPAYSARPGDALDHSNFFRCSAGQWR